MKVGKCVKIVQSRLFVSEGVIWIKPVVNHNDRVLLAFKVAFIALEMNSNVTTFQVGNFAP